jgi:hypothetical protein
MTLVTKAQRKDLTLAGEAARNVQLQSIELHSLKFSCGESTKASETGGYSPEIKIKVEWGYSEVARTLSVSTALGAEIPSDSGGEVIAATVDCVYVLTYSMPQKELPDKTRLNELFKAFAELNGPYTAWPYFRELTQSMLMRAGLHCPPLPFLRIEAATAEESQSATAGENTSADKT